MLAGPAPIPGLEAVRLDRGRYRDRVDRLVSEYEVVGGCRSKPGKPPGSTIQSSLISITDVRDLRSLMLDEVAHEVRAPVAEADHRDPDRFGHAVTRWRKSWTGVRRIN